ncbi:hypothetical protein BDN72DRAFT_748379, partial [Pluteus cervinus]
NWDVVCLQEPHVDKNGHVKVTADWSVIYPDNGVDGKIRARSVIAVNSMLDTNQWTALKIPNSGDLTAVQL